MPNGGSDCCATGWFNAKNGGEPGYDHIHDPGPSLCVIRSLDVSCSPTGPFYTYCANHPHRNTQRIKTPIGPVFTGDADGSRDIWFLSPDTEEIRAALLGLLAAITADPRDEYPRGLGLDEVVIWQLSAFREARAVPYLKRIEEFSREDSRANLYGKDCSAARAMAKEALKQIGSAQPREHLDSGGERGTIAAPS